MLKLCFNTNGLRNLALDEAIRHIGEAGYRGVEISLHPAHVLPWGYTPSDLDRIWRALEAYAVQPVCIATGAPNLLSGEDHEPSLITADPAERQKRVDLICATFELARHLSVPVVNLSTGFLKPSVDPGTAWQSLVDGVRACLEHAGNITLAIEPEPGMFIQSSTQAIDLIQQIDSPQFKLNLDIGHVNVIEDDFYEALERSAPFSGHMHVEDIKARVHHHLIPGEGDIDFEKVFSVLDSAGYSEWLSVELYPHADRWQQSLDQSYSVLQSAIESVCPLALSA